MNKALIVAALITAVSMPAMAEEIGVHAGPVGAGVTVGEPHYDRDRDRYRDHDTTVIKEREPRDHKTTVIKEREPRDKTVIHHDRD